MVPLLFAELIRFLSSRYFLNNGPYVMIPSIFASNVNTGQKYRFFILKFLKNKNKIFEKRVKKIEKNQN